MTPTTVDRVHTRGRTATRYTYVHPCGATIERIVPDQLPGDGVALSIAAACIVAALVIGLTSAPLSGGTLAALGSLALGSLLAWRVIRTTAEVITITRPADHR